MIFPENFFCFFFFIFSSLDDKNEKLWYIFAYGVARLLYSNLKLIFFHSNFLSHLNVCKFFTKCAFSIFFCVLKNWIKCVFDDCRWVVLLWWPVQLANRSNWISAHIYYLKNLLIELFCSFFFIMSPVQDKTNICSCFAVAAAFVWS